jgi:hypothetical protein
MTHLDIPIAADEALVAYPSQAEAARMLRVTEGGLKKWNGAQPERMGARGRRYRPSDVLAAAAHFRKRSLNAVAYELVQYAEEHAPEQAAEVRHEVEEFFRNRDRPPVPRDQFLKEARRTLPRRLYEQVRHSYEQDGEPLESVVTRGGEVPFNSGR